MMVGHFTTPWNWNVVSLHNFVKDPVVNNAPRLTNVIYEENWTS